MNSYHEIIDDEPTIDGFKIESFWDWLRNKVEKGPFEFTEETLRKVARDLLLYGNGVITLNEVRHDIELKWKPLPRPKRKTS